MARLLFEREIPLHRVCGQHRIPSPPNTGMLVSDVSQRGGAACILTPVPLSPAPASLLGALDEEAAPSRHFVTPTFFPS